MFIVKCFSNVFKDYLQLLVIKPANNDSSPDHLVQYVVPVQLRYIIFNIFSDLLSV
jgi:hypothetical protein